MNKRKRYIVLAIVFICTVYLFETYFLLPAREESRVSLEKEYRALNRYEYMLRGAGATEEVIKGLITDMKNIEKRLVSEKTDLLASARIQKEIGALTSKAGLNMSTVRPMSAVKEKGYSIIQVYFEGNGNIKQISEFLKLAEANPLLLKIDKLSLNITNMQKPDELRFKMQVSGLNKI